MKTETLLLIGLVGLGIYLATQSTAPAAIRPGIDPAPGTPYLPDASSPGSIAPPRGGGRPVRPGAPRPSIYTPGPVSLSGIAMI